MKALLLALSLALAASAAPARTLDTIKSTGKLVAATEGAFAPFNFYEKDKLTGFEVELAEAVVKKMGFAIEWKAGNFDTLLTGLAQNRWDVVIASHAITDERAKAVTFTAPHYCSGGIVVSKNPSIRKGNDLAGRSVAVQTGSTYYENVTKLGVTRNVRSFPSDVDARAALATSRVDAWVTDRFTAMESAKKNPELKFQLGDLLFTERIAAATEKGNTALADAWNKALAAVMADGTYAALAKKYFGEDVRCK
ncbi:substrate-binding periplasmic protein [Ramlibacter albus]|uniref:Amino acid ABC transporter substrate-binding protein n=1 Tax=Ramlibacter albus TaxID=2079448 RepID=A0A923S3J0_9BURK|nr:ABC transporter substrate-binding protein [Ramlibacter albus]MBC5766609.1 amino acid ABC transporter substrate-binding protein [Ramlibacter albus]